MFEFNIRRGKRVDIMAFRPSTGRRISGGGGGVVDNKIEDHNVNNNVKINDDDDINSYSSSDYDNPYHETASTWYNRVPRDVPGDRLVLVVAAVVKRVVIVV